MALMAALCIVAILHIAKAVKKCLATRVVLPYWHSTCSTSTVVVVLQNELDSLMLPIQRYSLPPTSFSVKRFNPRSMRMQTSFKLTV